MTMPWPTAIAAALAGLSAPSAPAPVLARIPPPLTVAPPAIPAPALPLARAPLAGDSDFEGELDLLDGRLVLRLFAHGAEGGTIDLVHPPSLLAALADRRFEPFWPEILRHAGPDLEQARADIVERTALAITAGAPSLPARRVPQEEMARPEVLARLQRFEAMVETGHFDAGVAEIQAAIAAASGADSFAEFQLRAALARRLRERGRGVEALVVLEQGEGDPQELANYRINRAAMLAESGRYSEALALIDDVRARLAKPLRASKLAGADIQTGWIRACALHGLGRSEEAERDFASLRAAGRRYSRTRIRALICLRDDDGLAAELLDELNGPPHLLSFALSIQPGFRGDSSMLAALARVAARPELKAVLDRRLRLLPPALAPAIRAWDGS